MESHRKWLHNKEFLNGTVQNFEVADVDLVSSNELYNVDPGLVLISQPEQVQKE